MSLTLHRVFEHLDTRSPNYARILFADFSSAFNTILPSKLIFKLKQLGVNYDVCKWIFSFLSDRPQVVRIGNNLSKSLVINTGAPQGCVLSPQLYSLFTHDCISLFSDCVVTKFADDTTVAGLISQGNEEHYREQVNTLVRWCSDNNLELNVAKTKEMIIDFRSGKHEVLPLFTNGTEVERTSTFKFWGIFISNSLGWAEHVDYCVRKAQQRLYFLRRLRKFRVSTDVLTMFYRAVIESVLTLSITVWYGSTTVDGKRKIARVIRTASQIIGIKLNSADEIYRQRTLARAHSITKDGSHPANALFQMMRRKYRSLPGRTKRSNRSFYNTAVRYLNGNFN